MERVGRVPGGGEAVVLKAEQRARIGSGVTGPGAALWVEVENVQIAGELLETPEVRACLELVVAWTTEHLAESELSEKIGNDIREGMEKSQREFLLRRQLAAIRNELGEGEPEDTIVVVATRVVLDADHHGLEEVKDRIAEYLAVRARRAERGLPVAGGRGSGAVMLLAGPPGVGKTSRRGADLG